VSRTRAVQPCDFAGSPVSSSIFLFSQPTTPPTPPLLNHKVLLASCANCRWWQGEFVERLDDNGWHNGLIAIAPHGGGIEPYTDQQAERVASQLAGKGVSSWRCKGWHPRGAFEHWHITSTDIHEASFPLLNSVISRGFRYAVAFHGFDDPAKSDILVGGLAPDALKEKVKEAIEGVVGSDFTVQITKPDEQFGGDDRRNIVNRLTAGGANGVQIEEKIGPREKHALAIAEALANIYDAKLGP
jgi:phage replication-related protein YjqB (UPF0714/DUF867 family)